MPNRILALDAYGTQLIAVVVETSFRSYQIVGYFSEPRSANVPLADQLRAFVSRHAMAADTVLSALPGSAAAYRILDLPFRDWRRLQQTVPFELESQVPFSVDESIVDFHVLGKTATGTRVFAALVPKVRIAEHLRVLSEAGLDPAVVDFAPLATLNVLSLFEGERPDRFGFLHIGSGEGTLALYRDGQLANLRVIAVGGEPLAAALGREIEWSLKTLADGSPSEAGSPPLLVGGALDATFLEELRQRTSAVVQRLEDLPLRRMPAALHGRQGLYAPALGLALREIADEPTLGLNFRRDTFSYRRGQEEVQDAISRLGILSGLILAAFLLWQGMSYYDLSRQYGELRNAIRGIFQTALPNTPVVDEIEQLDQESKRLQKLQQQLGFGPGGRISLLEALRQISENAPTDPRINADEISVDPDGIHLHGKTASFEAVETIRQRLAGAKLFGEVQVKDPHSTPDGQVEYRLNLLYPKASSG